jgi:hypothetical protein
VEIVNPSFVSDRESDSEKELLESEPGDISSNNVDQPNTEEKVESKSLSILWVEQTSKVKCSKSLTLHIFRTLLAQQNQRGNYVTQLFA